LGREINILNYLPEVIKSIKEFQAIATAENPELILLWETINNVINEQFINDASEYGVKRWEYILKIVPKGTDTLDFRKFRILIKLKKELPYTYRYLERYLINLCGANGFSLELKNNDYALIVKINLIAKKFFDEVGVFLDETVPANLIIDLKLIYNQHITLANYTHNQLHQFTHDYIRNEVLS
jgi:hypothetical protein